MLMTIPGLALFYGGLVRTKNVLSVLMQVLICFCMISILWVVYGYSLAFTQCLGSAHPFIGGFSKSLPGGRRHLDTGGDLLEGNLSSGTRLRHLPDDLRRITPALIVGAFAERMKFSAVLLFMVIWFTFAYLPMAHMVWLWAGPDAYTLSADNLDAVKAVVGEAAATDFLAKLAAATD